MTIESVPSVAGPLPAVSQIAFVVEDLEASMRRFGNVFGIEPWLLYRYEPPRLTATTYRGEPQEYSMRVAMTDIGGPIDLTAGVASGGFVKRILGWMRVLRDRISVRPSLVDRGMSALPTPRLPGVNVELIEPLRGPSIYTEHLDRNGEGIHHIGCFAYDDPHAAVETYENAGMGVIQSGAFEGLEFWYLDTREELDGLLFEIVANLWAVPEPDAVFPE